MHRTLRIRLTILGLALLWCGSPAAAQQQAAERKAPASRPAIPPARVPEGVEAHRDLAYVTDAHARQKLDLYVPADASEPLPLIIWVHGGGWQGGSKDGCPPLGAGYASRGYAVASIGYRLSGDAPFPAQIEDCKAAIRWLRAHADEYGLDAKRFGVWGSSAGGHLVALLGTSGDVSEFDVGEHLDMSSRAQAVCDYYGPTDLLVFVRTPRYERHAQAGSPESKLLGGTVEEVPEKAARANPITYVTRDDPPYLIVHGDQDGTVPPNQSELLHAALKEAGVSTHHHVIHGAGHGGPGFSAPVVTEMVQDFFDKRLKSASATDKPDASFSESTAEAAPQGRPNVPRGAAAPQGAERGQIPTFAAILARSNANQDGRVSKDEFRGPAQLFGRLDADGDRQLTREEHERAVRRRPTAGPRSQGAEARSPE